MEGGEVFELRVVSGGWVLVQDYTVCSSPIWTLDLDLGSDLDWIWVLGIRQGLRLTNRHCYPFCHHLRNCHPSVIESF